MLAIGSYNTLRVVRQAEQGLYLSDGEEDVLLPRKYVPEGLWVGDDVQVFVSTDSSDRPIATTLRPKGVVGEYVALRAKHVTPGGAYMDWGLEKDLLVPISEQHRRMGVGVTYLVLVQLDEKTRRPFGTTRLANHLNGDPTELTVGQQVSIIIAGETRIGMRVVAEGKYLATVFPDEIFEHLAIGDVRKGYVKQIREDGGIAISLSVQGQRGVEEVAPMILDRLRKAEGFLPVGDFSPPETIRREFGISKGTFKKAIGGLYRSGKIDLTNHGIRLL